MSDIDKSIAAKRGNWLLPPDEKQLQRVFDYADKKKEEVEKLTADFTNMGFLGLLRDSKIPEKDKTLYYFIAMTLSKRYHVLEEIEKYEEFYKDLSNAVIKVSNEEKQTDSEKGNPFVIILDLNEKLLKMADEAYLGKYVTSSSAVYNLHNSFIQKREKLEGMIKQIECAVLKEGYKKATTGWKESLQRMNGLESEMRNNVEKFDKLPVKFEKLMLNSEKIWKEQKTLTEITQKMEKQQEKFLQINEKMDEEQEKMYQKNLKVEEEQDRLRRKALKVEEEQEKLRHKTLKIEEKEEKLRKKNWKLEEEQEKLRKMNKKTEEKLEKLPPRNKKGMKKKRYYYKKYP